MKTKSLISKLKKTGLKIVESQVNGNTQFSVVGPVNTLYFWDSDGFVQCLKTRPTVVTDTNPFNQNCYNWFHDSMKSAISALTEGQ